MTGTLALLRAALRRDRWMVLWWTVGIVLVYYATAAAMPTTYTSQGALDRAAASLEGNAAYVALSGPTRALDTYGGQVAWQTQVFGSVMIGLMAMFLVVRHTRAEEESGRDEVIRSTPVGALAPALAGVLVSLGASLVIGVLCGLSVWATGLAPADSMALGLGLTMTGFVFTASAWAAAQIGSSARSAYGVAGALLGVAYGLRAVGDVAEGGALGFLRWLSPIGWYSQMHAFSGLRWWPLAIGVVGAILTLAGAAWLVGRRDYGAGLRPDRPGPARGSLRSGLGLALRMQRGSIIGWSLGMLVGGLSYGAIGDSVRDLIGDSDAVNDMFAGGSQDLVDGFYSVAIVMLALIVAGFAIASAGRPRREEEDGRAEVVLASALGRGRWLGGHVLVTVLGTAVVLACAGLGLGLGYYSATGDASYAWRITWPVLQYLPCVLVLSGVSRLLFGVLPTRMALGWLPLAYVAVVLMFGELFRLPGWARGISPFDHLAAVPVEPFRVLPVVAVALVAAVLSAAGQVAFRRRDVS